MTVNRRLRRRREEKAANALTPDHRKAIEIQRTQDKIDGVDPAVPPSTWLPIESREIKSAAASALELQQIEEET